MSRKKSAPEAEIIKENIEPTTLDELMGSRFDIYAKDVIQDRAIPDARDGLKPVQRRIVYAMWKTGNTIEKPTRKCAKIVGEVIGNYHPHGDSSIYNALVRLSQPWIMRAPLISFQGNNGSMDGDGAAAYRYTEARLSAISQELVRDLDKDAVDMQLTFDDATEEPTVLPARFPNLLVNGATGIAVGMATEIPPHNLREISQAVIYRIQHPHCPIETLMRFVPGPDFPTGGIIYQSQGLQDIYLKGRGKIEIASKTSVETSPEGLTQIIVSEIPYGVVKSKLVHDIDQIRRDKTIDGIDEVRDETDKDGLRIAIDLKKGFKPESVLAYLMAKTPLKTTYSANMVAIVYGRPLTLDLLSYCDTYITHQKEVVTRRTKWCLDKDEHRLEIVLGLLKAASIIDQVIAVIRGSNDKADAKANLMAEFGFTVDQAEAIVMMPLYKLSHTDVATLENERDTLEAEIKEFKAILSNESKLEALLISDLREVAKKYGDDRRSSIEEADTSKKPVDKRELIAEEDVMLAVSRDGYVKRSSIASWKGSGGQNGILPGLKDGDTCVYAHQALSTDFLLAFTSRGNYLYVPIHVLKVNKWLDEGQHVNYAVSLLPGEKIVKAFAVSSFRDDLFICFLSKKGQIKRCKLSTFPVARYNRPIRGMKILGEDEIVDVALSSGNSRLVVISENGLAVSYNENRVPITAPGSGGIKAASFKGAMAVGLLSFLPDEGSGKFLLVTDLACVRVHTLSSIPETDRISKATIIFKFFKGEPHEAVYVEKLTNREAPCTLSATLSNGEKFDIEIEDLYVTPMDKYAKKGAALPKKAHIAHIDCYGDDPIDDSYPSYAPEVSEEAEEEEPEPLSLEEDRPAEKFEQISIFADDDEDF